MRKKNSLKNIITALLCNGISVIVGFIAQAIFLHFLGIDFLGLNSLFGSVISMLSLTELGVGAAITYCLYGPVANDDIPTIKTLLRFYKNSYRVIMLIIFFVGILSLPLLRFIVDLDSAPSNINVYIIFLMLLSDTIISYYSAHKRSLLHAQQKDYITNIIKIGYVILLNIFQLSILAITKNYYLYLAARIIMRVGENIAVSKITNKVYPYVKEQNVVSLDKKSRNFIAKRVGAMFFHKIGAFVVFGTDNIIISTFLSLRTVGMYSNYHLIISAVSTLFGQITNALTASVGNLVAKESAEKQFSIFKKIRFLNFWVVTFVATAILVIMDSFIKVWIGEEFILSSMVLIVLVVNYYLNGTRSSIGIFKDTAGLFYEDRFVPIAESLVNIVASLILVQFFGLAGVFLGTITSSLVLWCFSFPKFVYKKLFKRTYVNYAAETGGYFLLFLLIAGLSYAMSNLVNINNIYINFIIKACMGVLLPNILMLVLFFRNSNFLYFFNMASASIKKIRFHRYRNHT